RHTRFSRDWSSDVCSSDLAFKERAVHLSKERKNLSELARELGIFPAQLYRWRKEQEEFGIGSFPGNGNVKQTPEQERINALEKRSEERRVGKEGREEGSPY